MKKISTVLGVLLLALGWVGGAHAITLSALLEGGSITAGDKLFDQWQLVSYQSSDQFRDFNPAHIDVTALPDGGLDPGPGLRFDVVGGELNVVGDGLFAYVNLIFDFRVSVLDPMLRIKDNSLELTTGFLSYTTDADYSLGLRVHEVIGSGPGPDDLVLNQTEFSVQRAGGGGETFISQTLAQAAFEPRSEVWVRKDIRVWAVDETDTAGLLRFEQRFSQAVVPEPGTFLLLGSGLAGLAAWRRRRS